MPGTQIPFAPDLACAAGTAPDEIGFASAGDRDPVAVPAVDTLDGDALAAALLIGGSRVDGLGGGVVMSWGLGGSLVDGLFGGGVLRNWGLEVLRNWGLGVLRN